MNKYIYYLLAVVCAAFLARLVPNCVNITSHYVNESIEREYVKDYSVVDKRQSYKSTKGSSTIEFLLTVSYADSLYLVEVPATVYDQAKTGLGEKLTDAKLIYNKDLKAIKYVSENTPLRSMLTYWAMLAICLTLVYYFVHKGRKAGKEA